MTPVVVPFKRAQSHQLPRKARHNFHWNATSLALDATHDLPRPESLTRISLSVLSAYKPHALATGGGDAAFVSTVASRVTHAGAGASTYCTEIELIQCRSPCGAWDSKNTCPMCEPQLLQHTSLCARTPMCETSPPPETAAL